MRRIINSVDTLESFMKSLPTFWLYGYRLFTVCLVFILASQGFGQSPSLPKDWADQVQFRSIGPANMSGRITSIAVYEDDPNI